MQLGRWMSYWMHVVSYLCFLFKVDPFNQPDVELGKKYCHEFLTGQRPMNPLIDTVAL